MIEFEVIDNFLPDDQFTKLSSYLLSQDFPWFYTEHVSLDPIDNNIKNKEAVETDGYAHLFYDRDIGLEAVTHKVMEDFNKQIQNNFGITYNDIIRSRASIKHPKIGYTEE